MFSRTCRTTAILVFVASLFWIFAVANVQASHLAALPIGNTNALASTGILYSQPPNPAGGLYLSSLLEPDGSAYDEWVWDDFTLGSTQTITEVQWRGGYDPNLTPGGPVIGFKIKFYPTNLTGLEPDVNNPLVDYTLNDNASEAPAEVLGGVQTYDYHYVLPTPFQAMGGTKYWVQIEGVQQGGIGGSPTWGLSAGMNGDGYHFRRYSNGGIYRIFPGDTAFALLGPVVPISNLSAINNSPTALGQPTAFTATVTAGNGISYSWNFGDGAFGTGRTLTHTYGAVGSYTSIITASNSLNTLTATTPVTVFNAGPIANAGLDQTVAADTPVELNGSGSFAAAGCWPLTYFWQQVGGMPIVLSSNTISQPTFIAPSVPTVLTFTLVVTDSFGLVSNPDQVRITVTYNYRIYLPLVLRSS